MSGSSVTVPLDVRIYSLEVAQRAAIKFTDIASFEFTFEGEHALVLLVTFKAGLEINEQDFHGRFQNELLDQRLRETVAEETRTSGT